MTPRALSFVAVALLAVGASGAVQSFTEKRWVIERPMRSGVDLVIVSGEEGIRFQAGKGFWDGQYSTNLTRDEAASLGRALLEAAGQPEKVCPTLPTCSSQWGCITLMPNTTPTDGAIMPRIAPLGEIKQ